MKKIIASTLAAAGLFGGGLAQAAGADLSVKGKLRTGACSVVLGNGGTFDLGAIRAADLFRDEARAFFENDMPLTISCSTATRFALSLQDNRPGTAIDAFAPEVSYGLGLSGGKKIGSANMFLYEAPGGMAGRSGW